MRVESCIEKIEKRNHRNTQMSIVILLRQREQADFIS